MLSPEWQCMHVDFRLDTSIAAMAERALAAATGLLVPVGLSMGGIVALEMWRQAPQRLSALALFATNPGADLPERGARRADQVARARAGHLGEIAVCELGPAYAGRQPPDRYLLDTVQAMAVEQGPQAFAAQSLALSIRADSWPHLAGIARPVLLACGSDDRICPPEMHERMAALLPCVHMLTLAGAGHLAPLEQPAAAALILRSWLRQCCPTAGIPNFTTL
jgi:pimeloyl-ACP methyl ester carboxylesterase